MKGPGPGPGPRARAQGPRAVGRRSARGARGLGPGPGPFAKLLNEFVSQRSYFLLAELIMARRNASELIIGITAVSNERILDTCKNMF